ncbi:MAG: hypothetical protein ACK4VV_17280 [Pseudomonas sp.]
MRKQILVSLSTAFLLVVTALPAFASTYLGSWDLRGLGQNDLVYRESSGIRIVQSNGVRRDYPVGNVSWTFFGAYDTDGKPGSELVLRAGTDVLIIDHAYQTTRRYGVGNVSWAIERAADLTSNGADELIVRFGNSLRIISDSNSSQRDINFPGNQSWALMDLANLSGQGLDLVINIPGGARIVDPRRATYKDFNFSGFSEVYGVADLRGRSDLQVIGRTSTELWVITGGVSGSVKRYPVTTQQSWAIYQRTADTDGSAGEEVILILPTSIKIVRHRTGTVKTYNFNSNYTVDALQDMDGRPGLEIIVRLAGGMTRIVNDRLGTITN